MIMSTIKQLNNILVYTKLNPKSFSEKIGLARPQAIYDIQKGKTKNFSHAMINKILSAFPEFNKSWLLTGEGEMLIEKEKTTSTENLIKEDLKDRCKSLEESVRLLKKENELLKRILDLTDQIYFLENSKHKSKNDQIKED